MKIIFAGLRGSPFSNRAADVRQNAFAELFVELGYEVEIGNRFSRTKNNREFCRYKVMEPFRNVKARGKASFVFFLYPDVTFGTAKIATFPLFSAYRHHIRLFRPHY